MVFTSIHFAGARVIIKVSGHRHRGLAGSYDIKIGLFKRWIAWWLAADSGFDAQQLKCIN